MKFWNRRNKIEFFHNEPSIIENFPIIESKDLKLNWIKEAKRDFQKNEKEGTVNKPGFTHLSRCPGIFDLFKYGYIIPLHKDIIIKPKGKEFDYVLPSKPHRDRTFTISWQSGNLIAKPPWAANFVIKIETGWNVIAPKGIKFIMLPIAYPDTFDFTATTGILNPALATQINFQMFWNGTDKETIIRAGTPLGHLIPLSEKKYQMVQRNMNQRDYDWVEKFYSAYDSTFSHSTMRRKVTNMYNKYWKR
jgi:hypothetical protein